ncbi:YHS domain-containing protein [Thermosulfuriphilus sp.]
MKIFLLLAAVVILYYLFWRPQGRDQSPKRPDDLSQRLVQDPVCGVYIPEKEAIKCIIQGETYHFCSHRCRELFLEGKGKPGQEA